MPSSASCAIALPPSSSSEAHLGRCCLKGRAGDTARSRPLSRRSQFPPRLAWLRRLFDLFLARDRYSERSLPSSTGILTDDGDDRRVAAWKPAVKFWTRKKFRRTSGLTRSIQRAFPIEKKDGVRWLDKLRQSTELPAIRGDASVSVIANSDIYELSAQFEKSERIS